MHISCIVWMSAMQLARPQQPQEIGQGQPLEVTSRSVPAEGPLL